MKTAEEDDDAVDDDDRDCCENDCGDYAMMYLTLQHAVLKLLSN